MKNEQVNILLVFLFFYMLPYSLFAPMVGLFALEMILFALVAGLFAQTQILFAL